MNPANPDERELAAFRQQYYGLLVALLSREPTAEMLRALREGISERADAARMLGAELGAGWADLQDVLPGLTVEAAAEEFMKLFIGPFQAEVSPYESKYLAGQLFQGPLVAVRKFLADIGLERQEGAYAEPEDVLAFELEIMNWLSTQQLLAGSPEEERHWLQHQAAFLRQHLLIWAPQCALDLEAAKSAVLYKGVALLLQGLLAMELQRLQGSQAGEIETLDEARRRYGSPRAFQGPIFDPGTLLKPGGDPPSGERK